MLIFLVIINFVMLTQAQDDVEKILNALRYKNEVHTVTTEDSYILSLHRIPSSKPKSMPVIIVHGMFASSISYIITGPGISKSKAIAFKLADNGYDVWLVDVRGTEFSKSHLYLSKSNPKYWNFSLDEIAKYDLPAIIDYILIKTNQTAAHYVGHSQGTTVIMAMLSILPQYNRKLKTLHLMAPSVYFKNVMPLLKSAAMLSVPLEDALNAVGIVETPPISLDIRRLAAYLCSTKSTITMEICKQIMFNAVMGPSHHINEEVFEISTITKFLRHMPNSISLMQFLHYVQLVRSGGDKFLQFDHKKEKNILMYNQSTPPQYQLSNVKTKIHFLYGTTDYIINSQDVERLLKEFKPWTIGISKIIGYNHFDFIIAKNVNEFVNSKILDLMNRYSN